MKKQRTTIQRPAVDGMTLTEVRTLRLLSHAEQIHVRLYPEERSNNGYGNDRQRTHETVLLDRP